MDELIILFYPVSHFLSLLNSMSNISRQRILNVMGTFRPAFRTVAQSLTDIDLVLVEEAFERLLLVSFFFISVDRNFIFCVFIFSVCLSGILYWLRLSFAQPPLFAQNPIQKKFKFLGAQANTCLGLH
jgi:hypothetical protein